MHLAHVCSISFPATALQDSLVYELPSAQKCSLLSGASHLHALRVIEESHTGTQVGTEAGGAVKA